MRSLILSQWKERRMGVIWQDLGALSLSYRIVTFCFDVFYRITIINLMHCLKNTLAFEHNFDIF